jgi:hypothetical protein
MVGSYVGNGSTLRKRLVVSVGKDGTPICLVFCCHRQINDNLVEDHCVVLHRAPPFLLASFLTILTSLSITHMLWERKRERFTRTPICPSMLRDTYAIRFVQAGGGLAALREQLGVTCLASVKRYQHCCEQRNEERQAQACPEESMSTRQPHRSKRRRRQKRRPGRGRRLSRL